MCELFWNGFYNANRLNRMYKIYRKMYLKLVVLTMDFSYKKHNVPPNVPLESL